MALFWSLIKGSVLGLVMGGFFIVVLAMLFPRDLPTATPTAPLTDGPAAAASDTSTDETVVPQVAVVDDGPQTGTAPTVQSTSSTGVIALAETEPAALPEVEMSAPEPDLPPEPRTDLVAADDESPVFPNPQSRAPQTPVTERDVVVSTESAKPAAPVVVQDVAVGEDTIEVVVVDQVEGTVSDPAQTNEIGVEDPTLAAPSTIEDNASAPSVEFTLETDETTPQLGEVEAASVAPNVSETSSAPTTLEEPVVVESVVIAPSNEDDIVVTQQPDLDLSDTPTEVALAEEVTARPEPPLVNESANNLVEIAESDAPNVAANTDVPNPVEEPIELALPEADVSALPDIGQSELTDEPSQAPVVVSILNRDETATALPTGNSGIRINRIRTSPPVVEEVETAEVQPDQPTAALEAYAAPFENPQGLPLIAVALFDTGALPNASASLDGVNLPLTIVLDGARSEAAAQMAAYRAAGLEVAGTVALPDGATASDAAIALEAGRLNLPEAVAYVDVAGVAQNNRELTAQFALAAAEMGQGLVIEGQSLNSGLNDAQALGVPVGEIFRNLAGAQQDARVLERFLAQAAFQARQDNAVVLVGELNAETLDALRNFLDTPRGKQVALAPLSAVLALQSN